MFFLLLLFAFFYGLGYIFGMFYLHISVAVVILYTYPAIIAVASVFVFKEKVTLRIASALLLTFGGILFTLGIFGGVGEISFAGCALVFSASIGAAGYGMASKELTKKYHALTITFYAFAGCVLPLLWAIPVFWPRPFPGWEPLLLMALMGLLPNVAGFLLFVIGLRYLRASEAGIVASTEPVFSILFAALLLHEPIGGSQIFGAALVLSAIVLLQWPGFQKETLN